MTDLVEPYREIFAVSVAARHCKLLGAMFEAVVLHDTCHLNKETNAASTLYAPISVRHD